MQLQKIPFSDLIFQPLRIIVFCKRLTLMLNK